MLAPSAGHRTLAGHGIWLADAAVADGSREQLAALVLAGLDLCASGCRLEHDSLGRPLLLDSGDALVPVSLSFSRLGGRLWAAASRAPGLGVDVAAPWEFAAPYPEERVFAPGEKQAALALCPTAQDALALLWCLKEAGAKALGSGFHRLEPIELRATAFRATASGLACELRSPAEILPALAERLPGGWLAVAVRPQPGAMQ